MKQNALCLLFALTLIGTAHAQNTTTASNNTVNFTFLGEITHKTCTISNSGDKTVTMQTKTLSDFTTNEVDGGVVESIEFACPSTTPIKVTVTDRVQAATNRNYLKNKSGTCNGKACASNVGVKLKFLNNSNAELPNTSVNLGTQMTWRAASTGTATSQSETYKVKPYYVKDGTANMTTGGVEAEATFTFVYL